MLLDRMGFLDGQTTNPTLIAKNPEAKLRLERGQRFSKEEIFTFYKKVIRELSKLLPQGSISIEVYADLQTKADQMLSQAREMFSWIPNAHIKFPTTHEGLIAAHTFLKEGGRVNMTLCFNQEQAAAVYGATKGTKRGNVFASPFIGRLDDRGEHGIDLIANILRMYQKSDGHVEVLTASVRNLNHFLCALALRSDIITAPLGVISEWIDKRMMIPNEQFTSLIPQALAPIPYQEIDLTKDWKSFSIHHDLTDAGIERFSCDWNALIGE